ncbi:unnamed protein product [Chrysoparadoxa australica]
MCVLFFGGSPDACLALSTPPSSLVTYWGPFQSMAGTEELLESMLALLKASRACK